MKLNTTILLLLSLLFFFTKQEPKKLEYKGEIITTSNENITELVTFKISASNKPTYLKITAKGKITEDQSKTTHIISYHKNEKNINEREQLSLSETETSFMYLNKEQLKPEFYISVECEKYPCSYDFILEPKEYAELNLTDSFSYYVTESNKKMKFKISGIPYTPFENETNSNMTITIYAIGNLEIHTEIVNKIEFIKHKKYNAYLIKISEVNKLYEFIFTINGKPGDLINVGSHFHDGSEYSISHKTLSENGRLIFGYLKKNIKTMNCFKVNFSEDTYHLAYEIKNPFLHLRGSKEKYKDINITCVELDSEFDELFYFIKIINEESSKIINALQLPIIGSFLPFILSLGEVQAFYCTLADNDNIINYELSSNIFNSFDTEKYFEAFYYECDSFPLCEINDNTIKNATKIKNFNEKYDIAFDKKKLQNKSAISQKHYIVLLRCPGYAYIGFEEPKCTIFNNIYSSNYTFYLFRDIFLQKNYFYKFSLKDSNSLIKISFQEHIILERSKYIEILLNTYSGSIEAETINENGKYSVEKYEYNKQYIFNYTLKNITDDNTVEFLLNIKAKENSFYSVVLLMYSPYYAIVFYGSHYLFNFGKEKEQAIVVSGNLNNNGRYLYTEFKTYNCEFNIGFSYSEGYLNKTLEVKDNYALNIENIEDNQFFYYINRTGTNKTNVNCLLEVFPYDLGEYDSEWTKGIFLKDKESKKFIFNETIHYIEFLYPNVEINNNLNVEIKNPNNASFKITTFINDEKSLNNTYSISSDKNFIIKKNNWENICKESIIICGVSFAVSLESKENSIFEITVYTKNDNYNSNNNSDSKNDKLILYLLVGSGVVAFLAVILILIYIIKCKSKNDKLSQEVNTISFQEDRLI